ncbi:conserved hypothetical protein [Candidatus Methylacidithermus pantelleriae]|uniref:DUF362 domain-containing protein n=2 Tax=Candidatus Methylacidithermus pantelleriae TaxID=2744239 RepID=A0A8J2BJT8_9BACT|nr:conserved hypothetical protein [Candidatus Methylacidithermus pantelleriae]
MNRHRFLRTLSQNPPSFRRLGLAAVALGLFFLACPTQYGQATGKPGSVVVYLENPRVASQFQVDSEAVRTLFRQGLLRLCHTQSVVQAWREALGVQPSDTVGIKISTTAGPLMATRLALVRAIVDSLIESGLAPSQIIVWDKFEDDLRNSGYLPAPTELRCRVASVIPETGFDPHRYYVNELWGKLIWGDLLFRGTRPSAGQWRWELEHPAEASGGISSEDPSTSNRSFYARLATQICTKIVHVPVLVDHPSVGFLGCLADLALGIVDNSRRFLSEGIWGDPAIPEILSQDFVRTRTVLHVLDCLMIQYGGGPRCAPQYTYPLGGIYLSRDPVAIDSTVRARLETWRREAKLPPLGPRTRYIETAARYGLGIADPSKIELIALP